jgi:hypothetical protein
MKSAVCYNSSTILLLIGPDDSRLSVWKSIGSAHRAAIGERARRSAKFSLHLHHHQQRARSRDKCALLSGRPTRLNTRGAIDFVHMGARRGGILRRAHSVPPPQQAAAGMGAWANSEEAHDPLCERAARISFHLADEAHSLWTRIRPV